MLYRPARNEPGFVEIAHTGTAATSYGDSLAGCVLTNRRGRVLAELPAAAVLQPGRHFVVYLGYGVNDINPSPAATHGGIYYSNNTK